MAPVALARTRSRVVPTLPAAMMSAFAVRTFCSTTLPVSSVRSIRTSQRPSAARATEVTL